MATPNQEAIDTFINITGATEAIAVQKLEEHGGNLNEAVNAHFTEGDRNTPANMHETSVAAPQDDLMDVDEIEPQGPRLPLLSAPINTNPYSLLDPHFRRNIFNIDSDFPNRAPFVTHPREVRQIPIEVKDNNQPAGHSGPAPTIEDVTGTVHAHGPDTRGAVIIDDEDNEDVSAASTAQRDEQKDDILGDSSHDRNIGPSAPEFENLPDYSNDIEEEMVRAAIEASRREVEGAHNELADPVPTQSQSHMEDAELAHVVSLSLKTAQQEKALREQGEIAVASNVGPSKPAEVELGEFAASNGRLEPGSSSIQEDAEDVEEQPLVRHRSQRVSSGSDDVEVIEASPPSSPGRHDVGNHPQHNRNAFPSDEWGGISSEEHDEAVMLEAAMFGGIPEGTGYHFGYGPHQFMHAESHYPHRIPRPPSPSLAAQRLIREQQDDEYLAALQADREKELKAMEEAEARRLEEEAARQAAREEERRREEESRRKLEEEQELERQLAAKEASLPQEPASDDESAITLLVRMPDGSRRGRRFLKSDKLQFLFDFIDVGRAVKPGTYRLVRPYPRRAFSDGESALTLNELGLTSKQEALFLELI
ncbi:plant UBX domain-containing protein 8-like [Quercus lobata]|uniref:UBX domain-containing protein n=1 Tax=Quercus lobata TaxID=97700 RepID=A0A7N2N399_QUELO|nr:plant UBX domain-containing protein 8-like [Quercus lobata]